jgi:YegS/Rv2252/BmrU family lipid kinase
MEAAIVINRDKADRASVEEALRSAGIEGPIEMVDGSRITAQVTALLDQGAKRIIVGGGDGSVGAAAQALAGFDAALGILPLGTLNHFARDLGIPFELDKAVTLIAEGHVRAVDVAEVNDRVFVNNSAIGLYPLMVVDRDSQQQRLGRSKRLAMLVASLRTFWRFHDHRLRLTSEEGRSVVDTPLLFVGNNDYSLALPAAGRRKALDDGMLCVLVMRKKGVAGFLAATFRALIGRARPDDMVRMDAVTRLRVDSGRHILTISVDGETCRLSPPLDYRIRPGALRVIAPASA